MEDADAVAARGNAIEAEPANRVGYCLPGLAIEEDDRTGKRSATQAIIDRTDQRREAGGPAG